ncbi:MAG: antitoxin of toxin-antitoxin stability system [Thiohalomonadaceae bacterium]|nr:antitoxin of toxin-antitoxin stability system [Thiopseudomonas sp.]
MSKQAVFTMKLEPELRAEFMSVAVEEDRPASQILRELMRTYIKQRTQKLEYEDYLRQKVETGRDSMRLKEGRSNDEVEAKFSERRMQATTGRV